MARRRYHSRERRRRWYRARHFLQDEAKELSSLHRLDYYEIGRMVRQRARLWDEFDREATAKGWGREKRRKSWESRVLFWYRDSDFISKVEAERVVKIGAWRFTDTVGWSRVWFWFDYVRSLLPIEKQYGRSHRAAKYVTRKERLARVKKEAEKAVEEQNNEEGIRRLMRNAIENPANDKRITHYAQEKYGFKGKSLLRTAVARGYKR